MEHPGADFLASSGRHCSSQSFVNNIFQAVICWDHSGGHRSHSGLSPLSLGVIPLPLQCMIFPFECPSHSCSPRPGISQLIRVPSGEFYEPLCNPHSHVMLPPPADWITRKCCQSKLTGALSWNSYWSLSLPRNKQDSFSPNLLDTLKNLLFSG